MGDTVLLSLESLGKGIFGADFAAAVLRVEQSLENDADLKGKRTITVKLSIEPQGSIGTQRVALIEHCVTVALPKRATKSTGIINEKGAIGIAPMGGDARQTQLFPPAEVIDSAPEGLEAQALGLGAPDRLRLS